MWIENEAERYAFDRQGNTDPMKRFPEVMCALKRYDVLMDMVWDRQKQRWLCIRWVNGKPYPVWFVEEDNGAYREPDFRFVREMQALDWQVRFADIDDYLTYLEIEEQKREIDRIVTWEEYSRATYNDFVRDYLMKNPETNSRVSAAGGIGGWAESHLKRVASAMWQSGKPGARVSASVAAEETAWPDSSQTECSTQDPPTGSTRSQGNGTGSRSAA